MHGLLQEGTSGKRLGPFSEPAASENGNHLVARGVMRMSVCRDALALPSALVSSGAMLGLEQESACERLPA